MGLLCVVIDGVTGLTDTQVSKLTRIILINDDVLFIVNSYNPYLERVYISKNKGFKEIGSLYSKKVEEIKQTLELKFSQVCKSYRVEVHAGKDLSSFMLTKSANFETIILSNSNMANRHVIYLDLLSQLSGCNIIMLSQRGWPKSLLVTASVDPFSSCDMGAINDKAVVNAAKSFVSLFDAKFGLVHCRYIPTQLFEFSQEIREFHESHFSKFISACQINSNEAKIVAGNPESSLPSFVRAMGVDLLVVGYFSRNNSTRKFVGTTTESLLRKAPCDLLFVNN